MELEQRLKQLTDDRDNYEGLADESLKNKHLAMLLGPSAVGKSTIIGHILSQALERGVLAAEPGTSTTRKGRPSDPSSYHTDISREKIIEMIEQRKPINWSPSPTGEIYATLPEDFYAPYNFMACLPDSVPMLQAAGFKTTSFYIATSANSWYSQLEKDRMYQEDGKTFRPDFGQRMTEAMDSIVYIQNKYDVHRLVSKPGEESLRRIAARILKLTTGNFGGMFNDAPLTYDKEESFDACCSEMYSLAMELSIEFENSLAA